MVYGWRSEWFSRLNAFYEIKRVMHAPRGPSEVPRSMLLNAPYHIKQEYILYKGGDLNSFQDIMHFMKLSGWGMPKGDPQGSQGPCH